MPMDRGVRLQTFQSLPDEILILTEHRSLMILAECY